MSSGDAYWRYDEEAKAWYVAPENRLPGPYRQIHVEAIIDIDRNGNLAGIEIVDPECPAARKD